MFVTIRYNRNKYNQSADTDEDSPLKFVKLPFPRNQNPLSSPLRSSERRNRNRTPSPSDTDEKLVENSRENLVIPLEEPLRNSLFISSRAFQQDSTSNHATPEAVVMPKKSVEDAVISISLYLDRYIAARATQDKNSKLRSQELDLEWFHDVSLITDRLHLLKEAYRAILSVKRKKIAAKALNTSSAVPSPYMESSQDHTHFFNMNEDDLEDSGSNSENPVKRGVGRPKKIQN